MTKLLFWIVYAVIILIFTVIDYFTSSLYNLVSRGGCILVIYSSLSFVLVRSNSNFILDVPKKLSDFNEKVESWRQKQSKGPSADNPPPATPLSGEQVLEAVHAALSSITHASDRANAGFLIGAGIGGFIWGFGDFISFR